MVLVTENSPEVRPRTPRLVLFLLVAAVVAIPVLLFPYLSLDPAPSRIPDSNKLHSAALVVHVLTAAIAVVVGVLQLVPRMRARRALHRRLGLAFLLVG